MKKATIVLGAGASLDYGYPLWNGLKDELKGLDLSSFFDSIEETDPTTRSAYQNAHSEFLKALQAAPRKTLDQIVFEIDVPKSKHLDPTGWRLMNLVGFLLGQKEQGGIVGWVSDLQEVLVDHVAQFDAEGDQHKNHLDWLSVISLNYDRSFQHYVQHNFFQKVIGRQAFDPHWGAKGSAHFSRNTSFGLSQPHGRVSPLPNSHRSRAVGMNPSLVVNTGPSQGWRSAGNETSATYASKQICNKQNINRMGRTMYVVDEREASDYQHSNRHLQEAEVVFLLGLSPTGIDQSGLHFLEGRELYFSNPPPDQMQSKKLQASKNCQPMNATQMLRAKDFPAFFKKTMGL